MRRAEIEVDLAVPVAPSTTRAIREAAGVRGFSLEASATIGTPAPASETMRFRLPLSDAERVIDTVLTLPGVSGARIAQVDDYPPDDDPPSGAREPRRPLPPSGHQAAVADEQLVPLPLRHDRS